MPVSSISRISFRKFDDLTEQTADKLQLTYRKRLLTKAVEDIDELSQIEVIENILTQNGARVSDWSSYIQLLIAADNNSIKIAFDLPSVVAPTTSTSIPSPTMMTTTLMVSMTHPYLILILPSMRSMLPSSATVVVLPNLDDVATWLTIWRRIPSSERLHWDHLTSTTKKLILSC